eukprot:TRINITY_DN37447_c0_g1_i1.p1 TRINITY_DN37447_c0_g1~~TRINITY_DN37447_c0_g1_i1.p1  ORF type:complete len:1162 (+),score=221.08 TRINITY_DN37447_c0_g1_i1:169-3654(+)
MAGSSQTAGVSATVPFGAVEETSGYMRQRPGTAPPRTVELASGLASVMQRALGEVPGDMLEGPPAALPETATTFDLGKPQNAGGAWASHTDAGDFVASGSGARLGRGTGIGSCGSAGGIGGAVPSSTANECGMFGGTGVGLGSAGRSCSTDLSGVSSGCGVGGGGGGGSSGAGRGGWGGSDVTFGGCNSGGGRTRDVLHVPTENSCPSPAYEGSVRSAVTLGGITSDINTRTNCGAASKLGATDSVNGGCFTQGGSCGSTSSATVVEISRNCIVTSSSFVGGHVDETSVGYSRSFGDNVVDAGPATSNGWAVLHSVGGRQDLPPSPRWGCDSNGGVGGGSSGSKALSPPKITPAHGQPRELNGLHRTPSPPPQLAGGASSPGLRRTSVEWSPLVGAGDEPEAEQRRVEIANLRRDIGELLQKNRQLHTDLSQLNVQGIQSSFATSTLKDLRGSGDSRASRSSSDERRTLEERVLQLTEECRALEERRDAHLVLSTPQALDSHRADSFALASTLSDRDDLRQQIHASELARHAAEKRLATAEAALERTQETELMERNLAASTMDQEHLSQWFTKEAVVLKPELLEAEGRLAEVVAELASRQEEIEYSERQYAEVKGEYDTLVDANDSLRAKIVSTRERIATEQRSANTVEAEVNEMRAQLGLRKFNYGSSLDEAKKQNEEIEYTLQNCRAALDRSEAAAAASRAQERNLRDEQEALLSEQRVLENEAQMITRDHETEVAEIVARTEDVSAENTELSRRLADVLASKKECEVRDEECSQHCRSINQELLLERSHSSEAYTRSQAEMVEAEHNVEMLLRQLGEERHSNAELSREISIARGAAKDVARTPWVIADEKAAGRPKGWSGATLRMHREIELLKNWKAEASGVLHRMQADMGTAHDQYRRQLEKNTELQERLENMGRQARATVEETAASGSASASAPSPWEYAFPASAVATARGDTGGVPGGGVGTCLSGRSDGGVFGSSFESQPVGHAIGHLSDSFQDVSAGFTFGGGAASVCGFNDVGGRFSAELDGRRSGRLFVGPDVPERQDIGEYPMPSGGVGSVTGRIGVGDNVARRVGGGDPSGNCKRTVAARVDTGRGVLRSGPVDGPFYNEYCARQQERAPTAGSRVSAGPSALRGQRGNARKPCAQHARSASAGCLRRR